MDFRKFGTNDYLDEFVKSNNEYDRTYPANKGYALEILVDDDSPLVREIVASKGYGLDKLLYDEDPTVRAAVALQKYGLETLINDPEPIVRTVVAGVGYGLDVLKNDPDEMVRQVIARKGYNLDEFANDNDFQVKSIAISKLVEEHEHRIKRENSFINDLYRYPDFYNTDKDTFLYNHKDISEVTYDNTVDALFTLPSYKTIKRDILNSLYKDARNADLCDGNFSSIEYGSFRMTFYKDESDTAEQIAADYKDFTISKTEGNWVYSADIYVGTPVPDKTNFSQDRLIGTLTFISREGKFEIADNINEINNFYYGQEFNKLNDNAEIRSMISIIKDEIKEEENEYRVYNREEGKTPATPKRGAAVLNAHNKKETMERD